MHSFGLYSQTASINSSTRLSPPPLFPFVSHCTPYLATLSCHFLRHPQAKPIPCPLSFSAPTDFNRPCPHAPLSPIPLRNTILEYQFSRLFPMLLYSGFRTYVFVLRRHMGFPLDKFPVY